MSTFRTEWDLRRSLADAGLNVLADRVLATARPSLQFVRRQQPDDALTSGTSKLGGLPDLPQGFAWPHRPPPADADEHIRALREQRVRLRASTARTQSPDHDNEILALLSDSAREAWLQSIRDSQPKANRATSYIYGVADAMSGKSWCPPPRMPVTDLAATTYGYLADLPPSRLTDSAAAVVVRALKAAYPCKS